MCLFLRLLTTLGKKEGFDFGQSLPSIGFVFHGLSLFYVTDIFWCFIVMFIIYIIWYTCLFVLVNKITYIHIIIIIIQAFFFTVFRAVW